MRAVDLIIKKREGGRLTFQELEYMVRGFVEGEIPDYQMSSFLMAAFLRGLNYEETKYLTLAMIKSGDLLDLKDIPGIKVDKHSTGGVGDKTTLVLVPLVAAAGLKVVKMSGRALGHTGGTLDKLESIPGFRTDLSLDEMKRAASSIGAVLAGQTENLVPADKKIYALRDVTGTVDSLPLIASSIMSKKIAGGADRIVLDVKVGSGGFLPFVDRARALGELMAALGSEFRRKTVIVISSMEQPLGLAVGNAQEVKEAISTLKGKGPSDLVELCLVLGGEMLAAAGVAASPEEGRKSLEKLLEQGAGLAKMREIITAQGGSPEVLDNPDLLPRAAEQIEVQADKEGIVHWINAREIGWASLLLGAGRLRKDDKIDPAVGIVLRKKMGDAVAVGEPIAELHVNRRDNLAEVKERVKKSFVIGQDSPQLPPLIHDIVF
ncbi:MAG: thymidine phosphorylase [Thermacetogeniaceae bacterium]|jgi:pyrimidine-nucleoside phosphorylase|nr:thymidine phosphorylase [Thermoanaerobacterales bacterium]NLN20921.1 thymidine phosphorylase [Syntrophomonadaceae bacterium]HAF17726.1 thymidine phosphorylase [Peptococcaceae bacterium]